MSPVHVHLGIVPLTGVEKANLGHAKSVGKQRKTIWGDEMHSNTFDWEFRGGGWEYDRASRIEVAV